MERELLPPDRRPAGRYGKELRVTPECAEKIRLAATRAGDYQYIWLAQAVEAYARFLRNDRSKAPKKKPRSGEFRTIFASPETHAAIKAEAAEFGLWMHEFVGHAVDFFARYQRERKRGE